MFAKSSTGIAGAADLAGRNVGIPGRYGSGWIMLQALLASADLTPEDLDDRRIPRLRPAVGRPAGCCRCRDRVRQQRASPIKELGDETTVLTVDDIVPLPGNGLIVGASTLAAKHDALAAFVAATFRAMKDIKADPQVGWDASVATVPELATDPQTPVDLQKAVLAATIVMWENDQTATAGLGAIDVADWTASIEFLLSLPGGLVPNPVTADQLVTTELLPK